MLQDKHPLEHMGAHIPPTPDNMPALQVSEDTVLKAIRSFPAGSAPGPDGIRLQHLLELVQSQEAGSVLTAVTTFVNSLLDGKCHDDYQRILFGGKLIALDKRQAGFGLSLLATRGEGWPPNVHAHMQPKSFRAILVLDRSASEFRVDARQRYMLFDVSWKACVATTLLSNLTSVTRLTVSIETSCSNV